MNIAFLTNTYLPHIGGVARSVHSFSSTLRQLGHRVLIIAPEFPDMPAREEGVIRIPAIQNFNASDFSVVLPVPKHLREKLSAFNTEIIHSHHPFLLGTTAIRLSRMMRLPLVFTHHTRYEEYTHYVASEHIRLQRFIAEIATGYANLTDQVIAPSQSVRDLIVNRGVETPVSVLPTGVDTEAFHPDSSGAEQFRREWTIPEHAFVVGHMGRLAPEKNIGFLAESVADFLENRADSVFLVVGSGPSEKQIDEIFRRRKLTDRLVKTGSLSGPTLVSALNAMDVFTFASKSETQGMVITEAFSCGVPVVTLDAFGVCDLLEDGHNGIKLATDSPTEFCNAIDWVYRAPPQRRKSLKLAARNTAEKYSLLNTSEALIDLYREVLSRKRPGPDSGTTTGLEPLMSRIKIEWEIIKKISTAGEEALSATSQTNPGNRTR